MEYNRTVLDILTVIAAGLVIAMLLTGCATWALDEISATGRYDTYDDALDTRGRNNGAELTFTWRRYE
jgi:hypothetical protein